MARGFLFFSSFLLHPNKDIQNAYNHKDHVPHAARSTSTGLPGSGRRPPPPEPSYQPGGSGLYRSGHAQQTQVIAHVPPATTHHRRRRSAAPNLQGTSPPSPTSNNLPQERDDWVPEAAH
ncbi:hypothetical protein G6O67_005614 [Ophiocordyceps sinensis]|uniref:Uncharacterized protein n=1 Tax=Ophiocordyceps sinensis TaxID=72228 RepID=A0A8H4LWK9_9HYPO|nr:hypothetical protein G6O67_005614 [Ophiocordyceps sinensis]